MKLKSKLKLYEQFVEQSKQVAKPIDQVPVDQVSTDQNAEVRTEVIRDVDAILSNLTELSDRIGESTEISEELTIEVNELYEELFELTNGTTLNEGLLDWVKSPIKMMKIKKNLKGYQKALVQQAINDVDYEKKKKASQEDPDPKTLAVLKQANLAKNKALKDQVDAITERMTELTSGDEGLGKVAKLGKTKAKLAAAKIVLKATSGEEAKQLKLEISTIEDRITADTKSLKDYAAKSDTETSAEASSDQLATKAETEAKAKKEKEETEAKAKKEKEEAEAAAKPKKKKVEVEDEAETEVEAEPKKKKVEAEAEVEAEPKKKKVEAEAEAEAEVEAEPKKKKKKVTEESVEVTEESNGELTEEMPAHAKQMKKDGVSDEEIKDMHPEVEDEDLKEAEATEEVTESIKCSDKKGHSYKEIDKDGTVECENCGLRNSLSESIEVTEESVELPKTIKLDESLTIAQRFAKLM